MSGRQRIPRPESARPGGPAPWAALEPPARKYISLSAVRRALAAAGPAGPPEADGRPGGLRPAAVLAALFEEDGEARVVLTRRSSRLRSHTGEVSFPGGRLDNGEAALAAALREATEEVGIDAATVEIIGELTPLATLTGGSGITPFVGVLPGRPVLRPNPDEVEHAFDVSLAELVADGVYHQEVWDFPTLPARTLHFFELPDDLVWGATARMLVDLLERVLLAVEG